ncbi:TonB-dependent receptor domain-containing protein [Sphingomonas glacialis]|uniref:TonB-dependent receptor domain-containing protein n=1 Tax=Sphingomonas glacialis TaxID=658225 RepID=UPI001F4F248E|nr:TonB-dependent receptor [Sphingomonas glacialis]
MKIHAFLSATALGSLTLALPAAAWAAEPVTAAAAVAAAQTEQTTPPAPADGTSASEEDDSNIVVTGSRIRSPNAESNVPITSISSAEIFQSGRVQIGDVLNDLPQLRSTLSSQNSLTGSLGLRGINALDLRGLGTVRTLVLVNGRREVAADIVNNRAIVDTNTFPTDLIERVDIVTGGNSSVYGSDAVAGVVNFILKDNYDGLRLHGQTGISKYGDGGNQYISLVAGKNFADGRGNIAINAEFAHQERYFASDRPAFSHNDGFVTVETDPAGSVNGSDGIPDQTFFQDIRSSTISLGGQLGFRYSNAAAPCGLDGNGNAAARSAFTCTYLFQPDGSLVQQTGQRVGIGPNGSFLSGNGYSGRERELVALTPDLKRYAFNATGHFEVARAFVPFFEARFVRTEAFGSSSGPFFSQGQTVGDATTVAGFTDVSYSNSATNTVVNREGIRLDNPYLSAQARGVIQSQLVASVNSGVNPNTGTAYGTTAAGLAGQAAALRQIAAGTFRFSNRRNYLDLGVRDEAIKRDTYKAVIGVRGDFNDDWHYEVSANYGRHEETNIIAGNINAQRFLLANDTARNAAGQIVCRSQIDPAYANSRAGTTGTPTSTKAAILAADVAACVPLNPFGEGNISDAAKNYLTSTTTAGGRSTQLVLNGYVSGDSSQLFSLPGGPVAFSIGGEYRRETLKYTLDPVTQAGYNFYNAIQSFNAPSFEVKEAFGELRLPIVKDLPLLRELSVTGSGRVSDYKGSVGTVYTYSVGGTYKPITDFGFRGSYSTSVRSPYLGDLYSPAGQNFATVTDPCSNRNLANGTTFRVANCNAAGKPANYDYVYSSSLEIISGGNPNLKAETSTSLTLGGVFSPHYVPGLTLTADYWNITVNNVISSVAAQTILNLCYDSATLNNPFCGLFSRAGASGGARGEQQFRVLEGSLLQSSANFAKQKARGVDFTMDYTHQFDFGRVNLSGVWTHVIQRDNYNNPSNPSFKDVISQELGDPQDTFNINANVKLGVVTLGYGLRWIGKQYLGAYENYNGVNGQPPQNTDLAQVVFYPATAYHDLRIGVQVNDKFDLNLNVNNVGNTLPPYGLTGSGNGAIYDSRGRYFSVGVRARY